MWKPRLTRRFRPRATESRAIRADSSLGRFPFILILAAMGAVVPTVKGQLPLPPVDLERPQAPAEGAQPAADPRIAYRFLERYAPAEGAAPPGALGPYRVAFQEQIETSIEQPQATPRRSAVNVLVKYIERPVEVGGANNERVRSVVRRYESVRFDPDPRARPSDPTPFENLRLWVQKREVGEPPLLLNLTSGRPFREVEYHLAARQQIFVPDLIKLLPEIPVNVGQSWRVSGEGAMTLVGVPIRGGGLDGKLIEVQQIPGENFSQARMSVTGRLTLPSSEALINAQFQFSFITPNPDDAAAGSQELRVVDAVGGIVRLRLAQQERLASAQPNERLRESRHRDLILERRFDLEGQEPPMIPAEPPTPTQENSWTTYVDPENRYTFTFSQDFQLQRLADEQAAGVSLIRNRPNFPDLIHMEYQPQSREPESEFTKEIAEFWGQLGFNVERNQEGWMPAADWPDQRVFHITLTATPIRPQPGAAQQVAVEGYLIQFNQDATLRVRAATADTVNTLEFRELVEDILRGFKLGAPES